jgi:hypothetical protein
MAHIETYENNNLQVKVLEDESSIVVKFMGKSTERDPVQFIMPIFSDILKNSGNYNKGIVMNFEELSYMNSSTITPITKILERVKEDNGSLMLFYNKSKKWQELCFSALKIFETEDGRIEIIGK